VHKLIKELNLEKETVVNSLFCTYINTNYAKLYGYFSVRSNLIIKSGGGIISEEEFLNLIKPGSIVIMYTERCYEDHIKKIVTTKGLVLNNCVVQSSGLLTKSAL
jgi:hypothetical protein